MSSVPGERRGPQRGVLADALVPQLPTFSGEVIAAIAAEVPPYARPLEGAFGRGVRRGVEEALRRFVALLREGGVAHDPDAFAVNRALGRGEARQGRDLDALLAAYRIGARVVWRRLGEVAVGLGLEAGELVRIGEILFAYIDQLSAAAAEGYAVEQSALAGERERRRQRLSELLAADPPSDPPLVEAAAVAAAWTLPDQLAAVVLDGRTDATALLADPAVLTHTHGDEVRVVWVPDPDSPARRARLHRQLTGVRSAVGPTTSWRRAARSAAQARVALALVDRGVLPDTGPAFVQEHLSTLVLHADPEAIHALADRRLAPLRDLPAPTRLRLAETLHAWLALHGARGAVAERLHVHPQTVRYRVTQLRDRFGDDLDDPDARFELEMVLRAVLPTLG